MMFIVIPLVIFLIISSKSYRRGGTSGVKIRNRGLEMMAYKGRLVYVRQTESEKYL